VPTSIYEQTAFDWDISREIPKPKGESRRRPAPRVSPAVAPTPAPAPAPEDDTERELLERRISAHLSAGRLDLSVTDNHYTMISVRRDKGPLYRVRLHHMFLAAPPNVTRALGRYIAVNDARASRELSLYIDDHRGAIRRPPRRRRPIVTLRTRGEVFDLQQVFDSLNDRYFENAIDARITWGISGTRRRRRRSIKMGSYSVEERLIRIHPALDRCFIPAYFLEWIVYHEMLHQVHDIPLVAGRRRFHTPQFLLQERAYEHYDRARLWERQNLDRILEY
jgi:hypothetical protein